MESRRLYGNLDLRGPVYVFSHCTAEAPPNIAFSYLFRDPIRLGSHDKVVPMQAFDLRRSPLNVQVARYHKVRLLLRPG
jgi:hypothetical protein